MPGSTATPFEGNSSPRFALLLVALLALAASLPGVRNGFAYDDVHIVERNPAVHQLADLPARFTETYWPSVALGSEGRLYRPLTIAAFAIEWAIGGGSPLPFHLVNTALYLLAALLVFRLACRFMDAGPAALAAALFAVHPVHTEAVGNVVGQGELLAAVLLLTGTLLLLDARRLGLTAPRFAGIVGCYAFAALAKEHAVLWPLFVLPLAWAVETELPPETRRGDAARLALVLGLTMVIYFSVRHAVTHGFTVDLIHPIWQGTSVTTRLATMLTVVPTWARLLFWPAHLQADYAPQVFSLSTSFGAAQLPGILLLGAFGLLLLAGIRWAPAAAAGLGWLALGLGPVANIAAPTGIIAAERTLFLPSVGLALAVGALVAALSRRAPDRARARLVAWGVASPLLLLGAWRSATRLPVWHDNTTLFSATVADAPRSYWAWRNWGGDLVLQSRTDEALAAYRHSLSLYDRDPAVYDDLASLYRRTGHCDTAVAIFRQALAIDSTRHMSASRLIGCLTTLGAYDLARAEARHRIAMGRDEFGSILALIDSAESRARAGAPVPPPPLRSP